ARVPLERNGANVMRWAVFILILGAGCAGCGHASNESVVRRDIDPMPATTSDSSVTEAERDSARRQIQQNWLVDPGLPGLKNMVAVVVVELNPEGTVQSATIEPSADSDNPDWQTFAESCRRAVYRSSPLRMPPGKPYAAWKRLTLTFNAKE